MRLYARLHAFVRQRWLVYKSNFFYIKTMELIKLIFAGLVVGIANVIPGVSGGTMAVVFGVYDRLIGVITLNVKKIFSEWKFWLPLGIGMVLGILIFSKVVTFLFEHYPVYTSFVFTGIVAGSIPMLYKRCCKTAGLAANAENTENSSGAKRARFPELSVVLCILVFFAFMMVLTFFNTSDLSEGVVQKTLDAALMTKLFIGGAIAAIAMIIPGISGSFFMLILGIYATIIAAVADLNIPLLVPMALGVIVGLFAGAGLVRLLMKKVPYQTYGGILGLVAGSVFAVLPFKGFAELCAAQGAAMPAIISLLCIAAGFCLAFFQKEN